MQIEKFQSSDHTAMLLLWISSLAVSFLLHATGEVVDNFKFCSQFFLDGKPPHSELEPRNPARICQLYKNKYRFATMYDKDQRIPMFSAYKYQPGKGVKPEEGMIEPQLALPNGHGRRSMELEETCGIDPTTLQNSQAVWADYKEGVLYDRGHLTPPSHLPDQDSKDATFTLTNIVPQLRKLNNEEWATYEQNMKGYTKGCRDSYVLVGAVPGNKLINYRVNVPSHIWAAVCCVSQTNQRSSKAFIAENNKNKVEPLDLKELEAQLRNLYRKKVDLFNGACK